MTDDLAYIRERIPNYRGYDDEPARHDSDSRIRAVLGESLSDARVRIALDDGQEEQYEAVLMQCMFNDQAFVKRYQHADLDEATLAALIASDRALVEIEEHIVDATTAEQLVVLLREVHDGLARRVNVQSA